MKHIRYARHNTSTLTCGCTQDKTGLLGESLDVSHPSALPKLLHMLTLPLCFCHLTSSFVPVTITTTTRGSRHWAGLHVDLPLFENDPSLRCCSDSLFCAVTALWLMTHHLMCLNLLVVFWCLCWFWMCGPPPSHMIGSTCCTPSTASCLTSRAPWLEWHPFLALQSRGDNLGDWKWQMSGQLYSQGGWCLQPASSPLCLSLLCQTVVSISVYSLWTSTEALVRLPRDWARPIFKHTNYFRYNNQMKQKLIAN